MFRKIVTESGYSPALAARLGEYTKNLRKETAKRQIGLIFVLLSVMVQLFSTLYPPESANAHNPEVFIDGGIQSVEEYLRYYDQNTTGVRDLFTSLGITRLDIETTIPTTLVSAPDMASWFLQNTRNDKDTAYKFSSSDGGTRVAYYRPLTHTAVPVQAYVGSSSLGWFAITKDTGILLSKNPTASICNTSSSISLDNQPATGDRESSDCNELLTTSLSVTSLSSRDHTSEEVRASDSIIYTLSVQNSSDDAALVPLSINLEDILEYAQIINQGGGQFDAKSKTLSWPNATLGANESLTRSFIIRLLPVIPAVAQGQYVKHSYDCTLSARFGNTINTPVSCPPVKYIEQVTGALPQLSTGANLFFATCLLILSLYLMLRSRQLLSELYIIRHNHLGAL